MHRSPSGSYRTSAPIALRSRRRVPNPFVEGGETGGLIEDASRGIDLNGSLKAAWDKMTKAGVKRIQSSDIVAA